MRASLTPKQAAVLAAIRRHLVDEGMAPTYGELARALGLRALATVHKHVVTLETKGYLTRSRCNTARALQVVDPGPNDQFFLDALREAFATGWRLSEACAVPTQAGVMERWRAQFLKERHGYDRDDSSVGPGDRRAVDRA